jgi:hypothetical protein
MNSQLLDFVMIFANRIDNRLFCESRYHERFSSTLAIMLDLIALVNGINYQPAESPFMIGSLRKCLVIDKRLPLKAPMLLFVFILKSRVSCKLGFGYVE